MADNPFDIFEKSDKPNSDTVGDIAVESGSPFDMFATDSVIDTKEAVNTIPVVATTPEPDNIWTGRTFSSSEIANLSQKYHVPEDEVRMYIATKGGAYDALAKAKEANSPAPVQDLIKRFSTELQKTGSDTTNHGASRSFINNILTAVENPKAWAKGNISETLLLPFIFDQYSGDKNELALKDEIDKLIAQDTNVGRMALQGATQTLLGGMAAKGAMAIPGVSGAVGAAKSAIGAPFRAAGEGIKSLAQRMGITSVPNVVAKTASTAAEYSKLMAGVSTAAGVSAAAIAPRGEKMEAGTVGAGLGAGIVLAGGLAGAGVGAGIQAIGAAKKLMTKAIDDFGEKAAAKTAGRVAEEAKLFDVAHLGKDTLPNDLNQLQDMARKLDVSEDLVTNLKRSPSFVRSLEIQAVGDEIAAKTHGVAEREAKLALIKEEIPASFDRKRINAEAELYTAMEKNKEIPQVNSLRQLKQYAEMFDLNYNMINRRAASAEYKTRFGYSPNKSMKDIPDLVQNRMKVAAYNEAVADYITGLDKDTIGLKRQLLNVAEGREVVGGDMVDDLYKKASEVIHLPDYWLKRKTNELLKNARQTVGEVIETLSPENKLVVDLAAYKRAIEIHAQREYTAFVDEFLPTYIKQKNTRVNLGQLFENIDSKRGVQNAIDSFDWIPDSVRRDVQQSIDGGIWDQGAKQLAEWADRITEGKQLSRVSFDSMRKYVNTAIHDMGENTDLMKAYWLEHRTQREMLSQAKAARAQHMIPMQPLSDVVGKYTLPKHVALDNIERRYPGINVSIPSLRLNNLRNVVDSMKDAHMVKLRDEGLDFITRQIKDGKISEQFLYDAIENPALIRTIGDAEDRMAAQTAVDTWKKVSNSLLEIAQEHGVKVSKRENWIHRTVMDTERSLLAIYDKLPVYESAVKGMDNPEFAKQLVADKGLNDFAKSLEWVTGHKVASPKEFGEAVAMLSDTRRIAENLSPKMSFTKARSVTGGIPELIRERNPEKLVTKYVDQLLRSSYLNPELIKLHGVARALDKLAGEAFKRAGETGGKSLEKISQAAADAAFIREMMREFAGYGGPGLLAEKVIAPFSRARLQKLATKFQGEPEKIDKALNAPRYMGEIISNLIFSSTLHRPASWLKNLTQIPLVTAEEVAHGAGTQMGINAMLKAGYVVARNSAGERIADKAMLEVVDRLTKAGKIPKSRVGEATVAIARAAEETGLSGHVKETARQVARTFKEEGKLAGIRDLTRLYADALLTPFGKTEQLNRLGTAFFADDVFRMTKLGKLTPEQAFGRISSPSVKSQLMKAAESGNLTGRELYLYEDYLLQKTQFVYNEAQKAKFIKDVGPILGAFLRYGSESAGIIANRIRSGKLGDVAETAVRQLTWLALGEQYISKLGEKSEALKARREAAIGKASLHKLAPITAATDYLAMGLAPSADQTYSMKIMSNLSKAIRGDAKAVGNITKTIIELTPFVAPAETIIDDMYKRALLGRSETDVRDAVKEISRGASKRWTEMEEDIMNLYDLD